MVSLVKDPRIINYIMNDPTIKPQMDPLGVFEGQDMDWTEYTEMPQYQFWMPDTMDGFVLTEQKVPGVREMHVGFLESLRGKAGIEFGKFVINVLFHTGDLYLYGNTPVNNRAGHIFNRKCGMKEMGEIYHPASGHCKTFAIVNPAFPDAVYDMIKRNLL